MSDDQTPEQEPEWVAGARTQVQRATYAEAWRYATPRLAVGAMCLLGGAAPFGDDWNLPFFQQPPTHNLLVDITVPVVCYCAGLAIATFSLSRAADAFTIAQRFTRDEYGFELFPDMPLGIPRDNNDTPDGPGNG